MRRNAAIWRAARRYDRRRNLPRDLGIIDGAKAMSAARAIGLAAEIALTRQIVRGLGHRIHLFVREGWRYESSATRGLVLLRLRTALAGELLYLRRLSGPGNGE